MNYFNGPSLVVEIPDTAIKACTASGNVTAVVKEWRIDLRFEAPQDLAIEYLKSTGGFEDLTSMTEDEANESILWLACFAIKEYGFFYLGD